MPSPDYGPELHAYLRLNRATPEEWCAGLPHLFHHSDLDLRPSAGASVLGALSLLPVKAGALGVLSVSQEMTLNVAGCAGPVWLLPLSGYCELAMGGVRQPVLPLAQVPAGRAFSLTLGADSRVLVAVLRQEAPDTEPQKEEQTRLAGRALEQFLKDSEYFHNHAHACACANALFEALASPMDGALPDSGPAEPDRRLMRAVEKIRSEPEWAFNLQELAGHSGVSERNLYYLMKRETGLTPYRFYQRCRLIRVRRRLVDCQCDVPHISWYAADEGFSHLGRFAALYREHFGELPSETVQWRRSLKIGKAPPRMSTATDKAS